MDYLFPRSSYITLTPVSSVRGGTTTFGQEVTIRDLRTTFDVRKSELRAANKGRISIYNAAQKTRAAFERDGLVLRLYAGYGAKPPLLFTGDIVRATADRDGSDIILSLDCLDGYVVMQAATINLSLAPGQTSTQLFNAIVAALNVPLGVVRGLEAKTFITGYTYSGMAVDALDLLCRNNKPRLVWAIQDAALQINPADDGWGNPIRLSADNGLIGYPSKTKVGITARSLLNAQLSAGRLVTVASDRFVGLVHAREISGEWWQRVAGRPEITVRLTEVGHRGDTHGPDWVTDIEGFFATERAPA